MSKKFVYICSPLRGNIQENIKTAQQYCRYAALLDPDVVPIAPHIYFTQFLDDNNPTERSLGIAAGLEMLGLCEEIWVFGIENPSEGMRNEIEYAKLHGLKIRNGFKAINSLPYRKGAGQ